MADKPATHRARAPLDPMTGVILGTAVGDALGLPREGLSRNRAKKLFGTPPLRHAFLFGRGMVSDDTEHTCMVGQALLESSQDVDAFAVSLGRRLRFWLLGLPAGVGRATLRAGIKLWLGYSPRHSGVYSAGNGPAMRAAVLGVCLGAHPDRLRCYVRASTHLTHRDPRAERGALLVALAAHHGAVRGPQGVCSSTFLNEVRETIPDLDEELQGMIDAIESHLRRGSAAVELADALHLRRGISGYIYHSVPLALYCWLSHPGNFRQAVEEVVALGGDADTTGALVGGIAGATVGEDGIPEDWLHGLLEWPRSVRWMRALAARLAKQFPAERSFLPRGRCHSSGLDFFPETCCFCPSYSCTASGDFCHPIEGRTKRSSSSEEPRCPRYALARGGCLVSRNWLWF